MVATQKYLNTIFIFESYGDPFVSKLFYEYYTVLYGLVEVSVKKDFTPRVTHEMILHQCNLE